MDDNEDCCCCWDWEIGVEGTECEDIDPRGPVGGSIPEFVVPGDAEAGPVVRGKLRLWTVVPQPPPPRPPRLYPPPLDEKWFRGPEGGTTPPGLVVDIS